MQCPCDIGSKTRNELDKRRKQVNDAQNGPFGFL